MSKDLRTPKYLREFVLSRCLGCTVRVEAIAREWTKQQRGQMPAFGSKELPDYAKGAASDFKQIRRAVLDLVETKGLRMHEEAHEKGQEPRDSCP
jgi:hypothetical protein